MGPRVVIVPGNGCGDVEDANWYGWVRDKLQEENIEVVLQSMPDSIMAREKYWVPFLRDEIKCDENTIVIGHSSGAIAAMRLAEIRKLHGIILVSAYASDLGDETEKKAGYFNRPWRWDKLKPNVKFVVQFGSTDDPFIPWEEQDKVSKGTNAKLMKYDNKGHFMVTQFPELVDTLLETIKEHQ